MTTYLGIAIVVYLVVMFGVALWANTKVENESDYLVAGRRLPLMLASATLLATWFGAGTLLTATDEIRYSGIPAAGLEPYGAGVCLILAGLFFAKPLWEMNILTIADFYREKFGKRTELLSVLFTVPGYIGWIAVQIVACAGIVKLFFGIPLEMGMLLITIIATLYTLLGGMWSVTVTDAIQMAFIIAGVLVLGFTTITALGDGTLINGLSSAWNGTPVKLRAFIPRENIYEFIGWWNLFLVASLGNIPGQDLAQRIFAAKSATVAKRACIVAGMVYILLGTLPVLMGLAARQLLPSAVTEAVLPALAQALLSPALTVIFVLSILSVVLSTIDSAILAAASPLAENFLRKHVPKTISSLRLCQISVLVVSCASFLLATSGAKAYELLEQAYAIGLVGLFVPMVAGLFMKYRYESSALWAMFVGIGIWIFEFFVDAWIPVATIAVLASLGTYWVHSHWKAKNPPVSYPQSVTT